MGVFFATSINPPSYLATAVALSIALAPIMRYSPPAHAGFFERRRGAISRIPVWLMLNLNSAIQKTRLLFRSSGLSILMFEFWAFS